MASIRDRGESELDRAEARDRELEEYWREECRKHTISRFHFDFYREHFIRDPSPGGYGHIEDPDNPFPEVTDWCMTGKGDVHAPSEFVCEGLRWRVTWKWEGGSDRASWDDGYWPEWLILVSKPMRWFPLIQTPRWERVYGPANVAAALRG